MPKNINPKKAAMPHQAPEVRNKNFDEVATGYTPVIAMEEATRCLRCKNRPCVSGCPVEVNIPGFIALIAAGRFESAYKEIAKTNSLPAVCGRVCPQESQCEKKCIHGIKGEPVGIGRLERFAADYHFANVGDSVDSAKIQKNGKKVAVIGAGPAGLTCAGVLSSKGYDVTVFEAFHEAGGVLLYGIPEFRLPKSIVAREINALKESGVKIETNVVVGKSITLDELIDEEGFSAIFIGTGAGLPLFMGIEGENLLGVYSANEFLTRINLMKAYLPGYDTPISRGGSVAVVGGGNVAMDAARCAKRLGAEKVYIVYRRSLEEMPARNEEIEHAYEEGVEILLLTAPVKILGDENGLVKGMECIKMELGEPDESGRCRPVAVDNSNFVLDIDTAVIAIGTSPNPLIGKTAKGVEVDKRGCIIVDDTLKTTRDKVFAGGDAVTGSATVILAMGAGKIAAESIDRLLSE